MADDNPPILDIYARVSRLGDTRMRPTTGQVEDCTARVAEHGARIGEILVDLGLSAWNPHVKRPDWDRLMERLESGGSDGAVVFDLARFSRRPIEGERLIQAAERGLVILDSEHEYDLTTADGKAHFRDQMKMAAYESDRLSTRVRRGKRLKARRGEGNTSTRPFGWEPDGRTHRKDEAAELRSLAARLLAGEPVNALLDDLNTRGATTSTGKPWKRASLRHVMTWPRVAGLNVHQGKVVGKLKDVEPILDPDVWEQVCALFASRSRGRPNSDTYLCSGVARCGLCGNKLTGRPKGTRYTDGEPVREYWCQPRTYDGGCGKIHVNVRALDAHVGALVVEILSDPRHAAAVQAAAESVADERAELDRVDAEITEVEHVAAELAGRLGRGEINLARHDAAVDPLDRRLAKLRTRRAELDLVLSAVPTAEAKAASRAEREVQWESATVPERRTMIRQALRGRRLVVMPGDPKHARRFDDRRVKLLP